MSTLTSSSTLDEVRAAYRENESYARNNSVAMAWDFIQACNFLLEERPNQSTRGSTGIGLNNDAIENLRNRAEAWINARGSSAGGSKSRHISFENFR